MKRYIFCLLLTLIFYSLLNAATNDWNEIKSTHFVIYYKGAPPDFIKQLIDNSEDYYNKIADELGFRRYNFWLWDNRAKIYIHDNAADYQSATGQPSWSMGCALVEAKIIQTFPYAQGFFETILPHEMGHIIFREFVGFDNVAIPLWLEEGVASYQEKLKYSLVKRMIREAIDKGNFMDLERLSNFNLQATANSDIAYLFYAEAVSMVEFLIKEFGKDKFVLFCQNLRDKKNLARAIAASYPFSNTQELNAAWQEYILNK